MPNDPFDRFAIMLLAALAVLIVTICMTSIIVTSMERRHAIEHGLVQVYDPETNKLTWVMPRETK